MTATLSGADSFDAASLRYIGAPWCYGLGRGEGGRMSLKTPSPRSCDSAPYWPMAVIQECNFMEAEVCPWRALELRLNGIHHVRFMGSGSLLLPVRNATASLAHPAHVPVL